MKLKGLIALLTVLTVNAVSSVTPAIARTRHHYPNFWLREAKCIRYQESRYHWHIPDGAYQIIKSTWSSFKPRGFHVYAAEAGTPSQQTFVAWRIWVHNGRSWGNNNQWPNSARVCGVY